MKCALIFYWEQIIGIAICDECPPPPPPPQKKKKKKKKKNILLNKWLCKNWNDYINNKTYGWIIAVLMS